VLGILRPIRLLNKFKPELIGKICCSDDRDDIVESIIYLNKQEIV